MPWIPRDEIRKIKEIDLLTYLEQCEPWELQRVTSREKKTQSHGSLRLSNGLWNWWAGDIGGKSALDYLIKVRGYSFLEAAAHLRSKNLVPAVRPAKDTRSKPPAHEFVPPMRFENEERILQYLNIERGIDEEILHDCIEKGILYEDKNYHNAIFIGFDDDGKAGYAAYRATNKNRILGESTGSQKKYAFRVYGDDRRNVHIFESTIDLLSWLTIEKMENGSWQSFCCLSMGGVSAGGAGQLPAPLQHYLEKNKEVEKVFIHFDRDETGWKAANSLAEKLAERKFDVALCWPTSGKDFNDELRNRRKKERNCDSFHSGIEENCR